jgi:hypothetical protein
VLRRRIGVQSQQLQSPVIVVVDSPAGLAHQRRRPLLVLALEVRVGLIVGRGRAAPGGLLRQWNRRLAAIEVVHHDATWHTRRKCTPLAGLAGGEAGGEAAQETKKSTKQLETKIARNLRTHFHAMA